MDRKRIELDGVCRQYYKIGEGKTKRNEKERRKMKNEE